MLDVIVGYPQFSLDTFFFPNNLNTKPHYNSSVFYSFPMVTSIKAVRVFSLTVLRVSKRTKRLWTYMRELNWNELTVLVHQCSNVVANLFQSQGEEIKSRKISEPSPLI